MVSNCDLVLHDVENPLSPNIKPTAPPDVEYPQYMITYHKEEYLGHEVLGGVGGGG